MNRLILFFGSVILFSCAKESEETEPKTTTVTYSTLIVDATTDAQDSTYKLTNLGSCTHNVDSGLFTASFTEGDYTQLDVSIKGFSTTSSTYTCTQSSDNTEGELGGKFNSCSVTLKIPSAAGASTFDGYEMFRSDSGQGSFTYAGACSIAITYAAPRVTGKVTCAGLIQTTLNSSNRNPISADVTASISTDSEFFCDPQ